MKSIVIIGAGRHGSEVHSYLQELCGRDSSFEFAGFADDSRSPLADGRMLGPIEGLRAVLTDTGREYRYITGVGSNQVRRDLVKRAENLGVGGFTPWTLRHETAYVGACVEIGDGTCLAPGVIVTTRVRIGRHCVLNVKVSVSHDCKLGDYVNLNPGVTVCGDVRVGEGAYIGAGATVKDKVSIGEWSIIGAGAAVVHDIPPYVTAVGVPARVIKRHEATA